MMDFILQVALWTGGVYLSLVVLLGVFAWLSPQGTEEDFRKYVFFSYLKAKDYCVLESSTSEYLEKLVNASMAYGYRPVGNISYGKGIISEDKWVQAVAKIG